CRCMDVLYPDQAEAYRSSDEPLGRGYATAFAFFFSSRRRHTRSYGDWSSDVCSSDLMHEILEDERTGPFGDHEAAALAIEWAGRRRRSAVALRQGLEENESGESDVREGRLASAGDGRVRPSRPDQPVGLTDRLAAGGARRGDA